MSISNINENGIPPVEAPERQPEEEHELILVPEPCPEPVKITIGGCEDSLEYHAGELELHSLGRILQLDVTLKRVCPGKRVALAAIVTEVLPGGHECKRGLKTVTVPAHYKKSCADVTVRCLNFVLPEDLDATDTPTSLCDKRKFKVRFIAHYIDSDFDCCCVTL